MNNEIMENISFFENLVKSFKHLPKKKLKDFLIHDLNSLNNLQTFLINLFRKDEVFMAKVREVLKSNLKEEQLQVIYKYIADIPKYVYSNISLKKSISSKIVIKSWNKSDFTKTINNVSEIYNISNFILANIFKEDVVKNIISESKNFSELMTEEFFNKFAIEENIKIVDQK